MGLFKRGERKPRTPADKKKSKIIIACILIIAIALGAGGFFMSRKKDNKESIINTSTARIGNIRSAISASGTIKPINMYEVTALVKGEVMSCTFEEGDVVSEGSILYNIDTAEMENTLEKAKLSMDKVKESHGSVLKQKEKLTIKSPINGVISQMFIKKGDVISNGAKICEIIDKSKMKLTIPFNSHDVKSLYVGQQADVTLENSFYTTYGEVVRVSSGSLVNENGVSVSYVDIVIDNPGAINKGDTATALIGEIACNMAGTFDYNEVKTVTAEVAGEVTSVYNSMGDQLYANNVIAVLKSDTVEENIKNSNRNLREAEISLNNTYEQLEDYVIKAPISGTIIEKNIKAGDKIDNGTSSKIMCVIADMSTIMFTINVDELDVSKIQINQKVDITADALPTSNFDGYVSNVNINGTTSNGVTTYPVDIIVNNPEGLLPGMNVNAEIVIAEKRGILTVPATAVMRGNTVYVKDGEKSDKEEKKEFENKGNKERPAFNGGQKGQFPQDDQSNRPQGQIPQGTNAPSESKTPSEGQSSGNQPKSITNSMIPEGFKAVKVETGLSDENNIEIISGLKEGDEVYVRAMPQSSGMSGFPGGMMGGMSGGMRMPSGGMSGGMSGGGMSGAMRR